MKFVPRPLEETADISRSRPNIRTFLSGAFSALLFMVFSLLGLFAVVKAFIPPYAMSPIILFVGIAINQDMSGGNYGSTYLSADGRFRCAPGARRSRR